MHNVVTQTAPAVKKRTIFAWSLWDWGSAAFNAVVSTFVFAVYITSDAFGPEEEVSAKLGFALTIAGLIVAVTAPVIGRVTDSRGKRKQWLGINTAIIVIIIALLSLVAPSETYLMLGLTLLAIGNVAYEFASVSYNAMLNQISTKENVGKISGFGWGMAYIGGIVLLGLILIGFIFPEQGWFGVSSENGWNVRMAMVLAAAWFGLFAIPTFFAIPEVDPDPAAQTSSIWGSYKDLFRTLAGLWRESRHTVFFLFSSAVFRDGLAGVFAFAGVIAARSFGFDSSTVIIFAIAANVVAGIATISLGFFEDRIGAKNVMMYSIILMVIFAVIIFTLAHQGAWVFWVFGLLLSIFVGPIQSASRSYLSRLIPPGREGEIFGLYATTGRAVSFLAPAAFGAAVALGGSTIFGILGIGLVMLLGLLLLIPVHASPAAGR